MTTPTTEASPNRCDPLIIEQQPDGSKRITTIFHWQHRYGKPAHTLVRVQTTPKQDKAVAVISEIFTNEAEANWYQNGIRYDLETIATSVTQLLEGELTVASERIRWIEHYGKFTTNTIGFTMGDGREAFMDINFVWNGQCYEYSVARLHEINAEEVKTVLGNLASEDLVSLLLEIGWTKLSQ